MNKKCFKCKDIGRILLGAIFAIFGLLKIVGFAGTVGYIASAGIPAATLVAVIAIAVELGAGLLLIAHKYVKYAVYALVIWMVLVTVIMHRNISDQMQLGQFLKNVGLIGGLLLMCSCMSCNKNGSCKDEKCCSKDKNPTVEEGCCGSGGCCR